MSGSRVGPACGVPAPTIPVSTPPVVTYTRARVPAESAKAPTDTDPPVGRVSRRSRKPTQPFLGVPLISCRTPTSAPAEATRSDAGRFEYTGVVTADGVPSTVL